MGKKTHWQLFASQSVSGSHNHVGRRWTFALQRRAGSTPANPPARQSKPITLRGQMVNPIIYISQPSSLSLLVIPRAKLCTRAQCPRRPALNWLNSLSQDPCTSLSSHGEDTRNKQLLHIPDGRARQMSKANQRERRGKVYEPAFANLSVLSSKTGYSWENSRPALSCEGLPQSGPTQQQRASGERNNHYILFRWHCCTEAIYSWTSRWE